MYSCVCVCVLYVYQMQLKADWLRQEILLRMSGSCSSLSLSLFKHTQNEWEQYERPDTPPPPPPPPPPDESDYLPPPSPEDDFDDDDIVMLPDSDREGEDRPQSRSPVSLDAEEARGQLFSRHNRPHSPMSDDEEEIERGPSSPERKPRENACIHAFRHI